MPDKDAPAASIREEAIATAAVFDLDGTITRRGTYTPFIWAVARCDPLKFVHVLPILAAAARYKLRFLPRARLKEIMLAAVLGGMSDAQVREHAAAFTDRCIVEGLRPGALQALERHRMAGDYLILATASFDFYAEIFGRRLGFDAVIATRALRDSEGGITGKIDGENCRGTAKLSRINTALPDLKTRFSVIAYSDHHADLPLLRWANLGIAVNPTRRLRKQAADDGFEIVDWNVA